MLTFQQISLSTYQCTLDLKALYEDKDLIRKFDERWIEFFASDPHHPALLKREGNIISYPHKSWVPKNVDLNRPRILILGGNPAPHSALKDIYYAYEGKGTEHRFWKVLRELGYWDLFGNDEILKERFLNVEYESPFIFGFEAMFTFPSPASTPKWSGVAGLEKLFGRKYLLRMYEVEKIRVKEQIKNFLQDSGMIIAMQKDAYNAVAENTYNVFKAAEGKLESKFGNTKIVGTPPTRWLHTKRMKKVLSDIRLQTLDI